MVLAVSDLYKSHGGRSVLTGVDLRIGPGEILGLLGVNGAGKSTLVSIVSGLYRPDSGTVQVGGVDMLSRPQQGRRLLGLAPQDLGVYPTATVRENLVYFGELVGLRGAHLRRRIDDVSTAFDLGALHGRLAKVLSGGEKRRLHTAAALLHRPQLLLLDEPTVGVDVVTRARLLEAVKAIAAEGTAICYSTHYLPELESLGSTIAILHGGRILARGTQEEIVAGHRTSVDLAFRGVPPPQLSRLPGAETRGTVVRIETTDPAQTAAQALTALAALGAGAAELLSVEIVRPSLEAVFMTLTGHQAGQDEDD